MSNYPSGYTEPESLDDYLARQDSYIEQLKGLLLWSLYHHQGASSPVGLPIRGLLGMGQHEQMTQEQIEIAHKSAGKL